MLNAKYIVKPTATPGVVEISITPKSLIKLTSKMIFWGMVPNLVLFGGLLWLDRDPKPTNTEDHLPKED